MDSQGRTVAELELELREYGVNTSGVGLAEELRSIAESWRSGSFVELDDPVQLERAVSYGAAVLELAAHTLEEVLA